MLLGGSNLLSRLLEHLPPHLLPGRLDRRSNPSGRLLGCVPARPLFRRRDLTRGFLRGFPSRLLLGGSNLLSRLLEHLPPHLLPGLLDRRSNPSGRLLGCVPARPLFRRRDLMRGFLRGFPSRLLLGGSNLPGRLLRGLAPHCVRKGSQLPRGSNRSPRCLRNTHRVELSLLLCRPLPNALVNVRLSVALFYRLAPSLLLLRVHVAMDQMLTILR